MESLFNLQSILASLLYSFIGIFILVVSFYIVEKVSPENLYSEVVDKGNSAIAIVAGAFMLAIAIIIASAIH
ncbi:MAG: hypothetical protein RI894_1393 [Bacteroidota bacterium]|jgi:uncharacterized membrane protein YjfL (UPF0719 family)